MSKGCAVAAELGVGGPGISDGYSAT